MSSGGAGRPAAAPTSRTPRAASRTLPPPSPGEMAMRGSAAADGAPLPRALAEVRAGPQLDLCEGSARQQQPSSVCESFCSVHSEVRSRDGAAAAGSDCCAAGSPALASASARGCELRGSLSAGRAFQYLFASLARLPPSCGRVLRPPELGCSDALPRSLPNGRVAFRERVHMFRGERTRVQACRRQRGVSAGGSAHPGLFDQAAGSPDLCASASSGQLSQLGHLIQDVPLSSGQLGHLITHVFRPARADVQRTCTGMYIKITIRLCARPPLTSRP